MATAEAPSFADNIKSLGDSIVKLTVLEAKALGDYLEVVHGIKPAAAAVVAGPAGGGGGAVRPSRSPSRPSSTWSWRPSAPTRSTSSRSSGPPPAWA